MTRALILFAHGARDARWAQPFERLATLLRSQLAVRPLQGIQQAVFPGAAQGKEVQGEEVQGEEVQGQEAQGPSETSVHLAFLEFMQPDLPQLVARLAAEGCRDMTLVPVFLGQGGHVLRDLPPMLVNLQAQFPEVALRQVPAVGEAAPVLAAIAAYCLDALPALS